MTQKIRKERITKAEWYDLGGFEHPALFRQQSRGGAWRYYKRIGSVEDRDDYSVSATLLADAIDVAVLEKAMTELPDWGNCRTGRISGDNGICAQMPKTERYRK